MHHPISYSHDRFTTLWRPARRRSAANRSAFTLVELLVVIAVIVALLGLVAAVAPRFGERQRPSRGAGQLQSWLNLAKQRALRDQRPRGIRLPSVSNPAWPPGVSYETELQFIELPEVFTGGQLWVPYNQTATADRYSYVFISGVEMQTQSDSVNAAVMPGDVLKVDEPNWEPRRIRAVTPTTYPQIAGTVYRLTLDQDLGGPYPIQLPIVPLGSPQPRQYPKEPPPPTEAYRILRSARPMPGEPLLTLPKDVGIDISREYVAPSNPRLPYWYRLFPPNGNTGGNGPFDILFEPSGRVIGFESTLGNRICLWVRDISTDVGPTQMPDGENSLITIYTRTGQVTAHPVDPSGILQINTATDNTLWNPFRFTQDGKSSGGQ
jgi:prepilin-type N-terminal cleavage/methylation domain-containing protein